MKPLLSSLVHFALGLFQHTCTDHNHLLSRASLLSLALPPLCRLRRERHDRTAPTDARGAAPLQDGRTHPNEVGTSCTAPPSALLRSPVVTRMEEPRTGLADVEPAQRILRRTVRLLDEFRPKEHGVHRIVPTLRGGEEVLERFANLVDETE